MTKKNRKVRVPNTVSASTVLNQKAEKIKLVAYMDSVSCATGFGTVSRNILSGLYTTGRYDIEQFAINYWGAKHNFPWWQHIVGLNNDKDPYGRKKVFNELQNMDFDLLFFLQDSFILDFLPELHKIMREKGKDFRSVVYYPIDGTPKAQWIRNVEVCDYVVTYSEFAKEQSLIQCPGMKTPLVIPHGVNTQEYFPLPADQVAGFRKQYFGPVADKFIVTNVNRNQQRKDIPRTIAAFAEFRKQVPESILYLHCAKKDQGWDLPQIVEAHGLSLSKDVIFPENFGANQGYPRHIVNAIYNASDLVVSTTLGEGFGLAWIEAMATKTPVLVPENTAMTEFVTDERGWRSKSGSNPSLYTVVPNDNEVVRPLVDVEDMVNKMVEIYNNREEAARRAENAYNWVVTRMDWAQSIVPMWLPVFDAAYTDLKSGRPVVAEVPGATKIIDAEQF